jgi:hypothetical protein
MGSLQIADHYTWDKNIYGDASSIFFIIVIIRMAMICYIVVYILWYVTNIITMSYIIVYDNDGVNNQYVWCAHPISNNVSAVYTSSLEVFILQHII